MWAVHIWHVHFPTKYYVASAPNSVRIRLVVNIGWIITLRKRRRFWVTVNVTCFFKLQHEYLPDFYSQTRGLLRFEPLATKLFTKLRTKIYKPRKTFHEINNKEQTILAVIFLKTNTVPLLDLSFSAFQGPPQWSAPWKKEQRDHNQSHSSVEEPGGK